MVIPLMNSLSFPRRLRVAGKLITFAAVLVAAPRFAKPLELGVPVHAWSILSDSAKGAQEVIAAAPAYGINQIQLSQRLNNRLRDLKDPTLNKLPLFNQCIDWAHAAGIQEVVGWDD